VAPAVAPPAAHAEEGPSRSFLYRIALVQVLSILGALVLGPLVLLAALCYVLRRYTSAPGALFRVEVVNSLAPGTAMIVPAPAAGQGGVPEVEAAAALAEPAQEAGAPEASTAEQFDLGPTYEEERLLQEAAARQAEEALLRHIYEENVRLREQIEDLEGAGGLESGLGDGPDSDVG
jgi:hypothetical protein